MRRHIAALLLRILNSRWLNNTPCSYEFVGNVDAFSRSDIEYTLNESPGLTLQEYIDRANSFKSCPMRKDGGLTVIEGDTHRDANWRDIEEFIEELKNLGGDK